MTNRIALFLGGIVVALLLADIFLADAANTLFLARKLADLTEYIAFWR